MTGNELCNFAPAKKKLCYIIDSELAKLPKEPEIRCTKMQKLICTAMKCGKRFLRPLHCYGYIFGSKEGNKEMKTKN